MKDSAIWDKLFHVSEPHFLHLVNEVISVKVIKFGCIGSLLLCTSCNQGLLLVAMPRPLITDHRL